MPVRPVVNNRGPPLDDDLETEAAVLANFDFLQNDVEDEEDNDDDKIELLLVELFKLLKLE